MATTEQAKAFIAEIAPIVQKYAKLYGYKVASPIIAQACCESAYGTSSLGYKYHNYFGMKCGSSWKGKSVNMSTKEEYTVGTLTDIKANFRVYDSMEEGIKGYFDFISASRYANLKTATTPNEYLTMIKNDGYATSSTYVTTNMNIINKWGLTAYDNLSENVNPYSEPTRILKKCPLLLFGNDVKWVQWHLVRLGYLPELNTKGKSNIDGWYGKDTESAVLNFQKAVFNNPTEWDGRVGSKTIAKLKL